MIQYASPGWFFNAKFAVYYSALSLIGIQVGIGIIMKLSQSGGQYSFSASSSVTISEFLKLLLSGLFFWRECRKRQTSFHATSTEFDTISNDAESASASASPSSQSSFEWRDSIELEKQGLTRTRLDARVFMRYCLDEISPKARYGFAQLALLYGLINNSVGARVI
jgi:hypothetical protein